MAANNATRYEIQEGQVTKDTTTMIMAYDDDGGCYDDNDDDDNTCPTMLILFWKSQCRDLAISCHIFNPIRHMIWPPAAK